MRPNTIPVALRGERPQQGRDVHARVRATAAPHRASSGTGAEATATGSAVPKSADASASGCLDHHRRGSAAESGSRDVRERTRALAAHGARGRVKHSNDMGRANSLQNQARKSLPQWRRVQLVWRSRDVFDQLPGLLVHAPDVAARATVVVNERAFAQRRQEPDLFTVARWTLQDRRHGWRDTSIDRLWLRFNGEYPSMGGLHLSG